MTCWCPARGRVLGAHSVAAPTETLHNRCGRDRASVMLDRFNRSVLPPTHVDESKSLIVVVRLPQVPVDTAPDRVDVDLAEVRRAQLGVGVAGSELSVHPPL